MEISQLEKFYKVHSKFYDYTRPFFLWNRKRAIELLDIQPSDIVIDFACGTGLNIPLLSQKTPGGKIIGVDYSESMLQEAKKNNPNVKFIQGDISKYVFEEKANKIICTYSLSMVDEWQKTIINMKNTLKSDGALVILDFNYSWRGVLKLCYPIFRWWLKKHGVDPEKPVTNFLKEHFKDVKVLVLNFGYNYIAIAKEPI